MGDILQIISWYNKRFCDKNILTIWIKILFSNELLSLITDSLFITAALLQWDSSGTALIKRGHNSSLSGVFIWKFLVVV